MEMFLLEALLLNTLILKSCLPLVAFFLAGWLRFFFNFSITITIIYTFLTFPRVFPFTLRCMGFEFNAYKQ